MPRRLVHTLITVILVFYALLIVAALLSDRLIFQPQRASYTDAELIAAVDSFAARRSDGGVASSQPAGKIYKLRSGDHTITAVHVPNAEARYTLLFSHGNAEDLGDNAPFFAALRDAGFGVFAYDYRGYGTSEGRPSERGVHQDVEAAYEFLTRELKVPPERIISFGRSVGSAAAIHVASRRPVAALIAESPFISAFRVMTRLPLLPWDKFDNARAMRQVRVPVLVIHGRRDRVIPFSHGERIYELAAGPKERYWIDEAGHNDVLFVAGAEYFRTIVAFAQGLEGGR